MAKNTLMLYFRQMLVMIVGFYTVRVVLNTLGVVDYGIYNVVAGVVTMFSFLSGSMASASQRYFSFEIGRGDFEQLKKTFAISLLIYGLIALAALVVLESAGLWFIHDKLVIPAGRFEAAQWVYQASVVSFLFTILITPYMSVIIAHEDMNLYAYVSIVDAVIKLLIVFILNFIAWDKLKLYGILMCAASVVTSAIYFTICSLKYRECVPRFYWNRALFKEITSYTGWNLFGASVGVFKVQIVNIALNQFFNPVVIAARGIAASATSAANSFAQSFSTAMRPQIIKTYATGRKDEMLRIVFNGAKGTYFLMYFFTLPLLLETPILLDLWLKNPPEHASLFTRLSLIDVLVESASYTIMAAAQATGRIKLYQSVVGGILLLNFPVSWIALSMGAPAYSVMVVAIGMAVLASIARQWILKRLIDYSITRFFAKVVVPIAIVSLLSAIVPLLLKHVIGYGFPRLCAVAVASVISVGACVFSFGIDTSERQKIKAFLRKKMAYGW
jgi:O-antigen/teichoic acid export membrane protein